MTVIESATISCGQYRIETLPTIHDADAAPWNDVVARAGGSVFHTWQWLAAFEDAPPGGFEPRHLIAYQGDEPVAVCPAYLVHDCPRLSYLMELADHTTDGPVLLAHSLAALDGGPLALPGHRDAVDALLTALEPAARAAGARTWGVANVPAGRTCGLLMGRGYATAHITTSYRCATDVPTAEDYWSFATGRLRRKYAKERRVSARGFTVRDTPADTATTVRLVHSLLTDRGTPTDVLPADFLGAVKERLAPFEQTVTSADADGRIVGVFAGWKFGATWSMWLAGLDTGALPSFVPYRAMAARLIGTAVATDVATVDLGRSNGPEKRKLGAHPVPLHLALDTSGRADRASLHAALRRLEQRCQGPDDQLDIARRCC
ncbi:GNAT family N-acetyltransferase [Streptomyces abyssomicinicus]|uniref:GNAT family N-acetyltransferase n=1 Tax=Streptomyces abyssomicinicus TaxID=574929 RepID=UPI00125005F7|nr:GNAT family N-acetyltransferase [Streptomyces abyssomicinicus]